MAGTGELLKRAQSEKDNPLGDIFWVADQTMLSPPPRICLWNMYRLRMKTCWMRSATPPVISLLHLRTRRSVIVNKDLKGDMKIEGFEDLLNP